MVKVFADKKKKYISRRRIEINTLLIEVGTGSSDTISNTHFDSNLSLRTLV